MSETKKRKELILLNIQGTDKPGVTATLTSILAAHNVDILDIGQAVIHNDLGLGILFAITDKSDSSSILKDLLFRAYELGLTVKFTPIPENTYNDWVSQQGKERYIITLLAQRLTALHVARVTTIIAEQNLNIDLN